MFGQLNARRTRNQDQWVSISILVHCLILTWLLHSPKPVFVAPSYVMKGQPGGALTRLYFGGATGVTQEQSSHLSLPKTASTNSHRTPPILSKAKEGSAIMAALRSNQPLGGSLYGSLSYGALSGPNVRPALPVFSPDPAIDREISNSLAGDVIIEVTIDEVGHITAMRLIQGLGAAVDQKVLDAVNRWQFEPATRNGTPIPSKQDVYYHFPR